MMHTFPTPRQPSKHRPLTFLSVLFALCILLSSIVFTHQSAHAMDPTFRHVELHVIASPGVPEIQDATIDALIAAENAVPQSAQATAFDANHDPVVHEEVPLVAANVERALPNNPRPGPDIFNLHLAGIAARQMTVGRTGLIIQRVGYQHYNYYLQVRSRSGLYHLQFDTEQLQNNPEVRAFLEGFRTKFAGLQATWSSLFRIITINAVASTFGALVAAALLHQYDLPTAYNITLILGIAVAAVVAAYPGYGNFLNTFDSFEAQYAGIFATYRALAHVLGESEPPEEPFPQFSVLTREPL